LHVFVVAPRDARVAAAIQRLAVARNEAEEVLDRKDDGRRRYVKTYYDRDWENAPDYHLVLNTGVFTHEQAAEMIVSAVKLRGW
jgi:cytidylate kinase